ncbi:MAG: type II toxin-antitoxin system Phd/YefM family antitoxin [Wenzhouxiangella sp.]
MSTASVSELKARLSAYLREVRQGGEVQVLDRGKPVARLVSLDVDRAEDNAADHQRRQRLIASGILRPGSGMDCSLQPLAISVDLGHALDDERADRL